MPRAFPFRKVQLIPGQKAYEAIQHAVSIPQGTINTLIDEKNFSWVHVSIPQGTINTPSYIVLHHFETLFPFRKVQLIQCSTRQPPLSSSVSIPQGTINTIKKVMKDKVLIMFPFRKVQLIPKNLIL